MKASRILLLAGMALLGLAWFSGSKTWKRTRASNGIHKSTSHPVNRGMKIKLEQKALAAKNFTRLKDYNNQYCFLLDMSLPSGQKRFFIYDLDGDSIRRSGLVAHGNCFEYWLEGRRYSNVVGSGCTSLGKYRIGGHYTGKWGYSYKLHGLDSTNDNALERTVVLHAHSCVAENEVADDICQSNGCPTVSPLFLEQLKTLINYSKKPVLLWIYE